MQRKISPTQQRVIDKLRDDGGRLYRVPGGFWTTRSTPNREGSCAGILGVQGTPQNPVPAWFVDSRTVRAMEKKGLLVRCNIHAEEWRDERRLTQPHSPDGEGASEKQEDR